MLRHTWSVKDVGKSVGKFVILLAAVVGLYALPNISADACPVDDDAAWNCAERVEADVAATGDLADVDRSGNRERTAAEGAEEGTDDGEDGLYDISRGELIIGADEWPHDLLTSTKWSFDLIEPTEDGRMLVVTYRTDEVSEAAPRVMRAQPARIQILDAFSEKVDLDIEFPEEIARVEWITDDRVALSTSTGAITVFERS